MDENVYNELYKENIGDMADTVKTKVGNIQMLIALSEKENEDKVKQDIEFEIKSLGRTLSVNIEDGIDFGKLPKDISEDEKKELENRSQSNIHEIQESIREFANQYMEKKNNGEDISYQEFYSKALERIGYNGKQIEDKFVFKNEQEDQSKESVVLANVKRAIENKVAEWSMCCNIKRNGSDIDLDYQLDEIEDSAYEIKKYVKWYGTNEEKEKLLEMIDKQVTGKREALKELSEKFLNGEIKNWQNLEELSISKFGYEKSKSQEMESSSKEGISTQEEKSIKEKLGELYGTQADLAKLAFALQKQKFKESLEELEQGSAVSKQVSTKNHEYKMGVLVAKEKLDKDLTNLQISKCENKGKINKARADMAIEKGNLREKSKDTVVKEIISMEKRIAQIDAKLKTAKSDVEKENLQKQRDAMDSIVKSAYATDVGKEYSEIKEKILSCKETIREGKRIIRDISKEEKKQKEECNKVIDGIKRIAKTEKEMLLPTNKSKFMAFFGKIKAKLGIGREKYDKNLIGMIEEAKGEIQSNILQPAKEKLTEVGNNTKEVVGKGAKAIGDNAKVIGNNAKAIGQVAINKAKSGAIAVGKGIEAVGSGIVATGVGTIDMAKNGYGAVKGYLESQSNNVLRKLGEHIDRRIQKNNERVQAMSEKIKDEGKNR